MKANLALFPIHRELRRVRQAAIQIDRRDADKANKWWRTECNRLYGWMQVLGVPPAEIDRQLNLYAVAVARERQTRRTATPEALSS